MNNDTEGMKNQTVSKIQREYFNRQAFLQKFTERDLLVPYSRLVGERVVSLSVQFHRAFFQYEFSHCFP
ncbi:CLUMA_CG016970, isoform A [Clunio marinus]|uniref:CLUMA_CG016970, isoform A n=1 Tax=Clunio marinus TaxID=568069 RepID=A0A1J1IV85_9DIPT|nr:CLUMA_CG016970, isoform A [Clunio marinus]